MAADELKTKPELSPFSLRVGVYDMSLTTEVRVDTPAGSFGTRIGFEDDLNLEKNAEAVNVAFRWRFKQRHFVEAEYFRINREGNRRIETEIRFGDDVFPIGANIRSAFTTEVTRLGYSYRIVRSRNWGLAVGAGVHVTRLRANLVEVQIDGGPSIGETEIARVTAPLPVFGIGGAARLSEKWALLGRAQYFTLEYDDIDGSIYHSAIYLEHDTFKNFGFGIGYDRFRVDVKTEEKYWRGRARVEFEGPMIFLKGSF